MFLISGPLTETPKESRCLSCLSYSVVKEPTSVERAASLPVPSVRVKRNVSAPCEPIPVDPDRRNSSLFRLLERTACVAGDCGFYVPAAACVNRTSRAPGLGRTRCPPPLFPALPYRRPSSNLNQTAPIAISPQPCTNCCAYWSYVVFSESNSRCEDTRTDLPHPLFHELPWAATHSKPSLYDAVSFASSARMSLPSDVLGIRLTL